MGPILHVKKITGFCCCTWDLDIWRSYEEVLFVLWMHLEMLSWVLLCGRSRGRKLKLLPMGNLKCEHHSVLKTSSSTLVWQWQFSWRLIMVTPTSEWFWEFTQKKWIHPWWIERQELLSALIQPIQAFMFAYPYYMVFSSSFCHWRDLGFYNYEYLNFILLCMGRFLYSRERERFLKSFPTCFKTLSEFAFRFWP